MADSAAFWAEVTTYLLFNYPLSTSYSGMLTSPIISDVQKYVASEYAGQPSPLVNHYNIIGQRLLLVCETSRDI